MGLGTSRARLSSSGALSGALAAAGMAPFAVLLHRLLASDAAAAPPAAVVPLASAVLYASPVILIGT